MSVAKLDTTTEIETPEHVFFRRPVAGPARRALAYAIDAVIRLVVVAGIGMVAGMAGAVEQGLGEASMGLVLVVLFVAEWAYFVVCEMAMDGRSPGKKAARLRVVTTSGHPLTLIDSVLRNLLRAADLLPTGYVLGALVMAQDERFRRLGDLVAGTMVVQEDPQRVADPLVIQPPPQAEELARFPSRIPIDRDELDAIEVYLRRLPSLHPARAEELAEMVAPVYARRLGMKPRDARRFLQLLFARARPAAVR